MSSALVVLSPEHYDAVRARYATRASFRAALWRAAGVVVVVGSYCAWLCSTIDARLGYFGGSENTALFIAGGVIPAIVGGALYGWILYGGGPFASRRAV